MERELSMTIVEPSQGNAETPEAIFLRLKLYCVELLELLHGSKKSASFLHEMAQFLRRAPPHALQPYLDFTLFPFLLLLDAAVQCRAGARAGSDAAPLSGHVISDSVAEGLLACLEELLSKCHLGSVEQMVVVMKKLTSGALLSPSEAAEEFREGIIRCFRLMLLRLEACVVMSCTCKQISGLPSVIPKGTSQAQHDNTLKYESKPKECLLAFLQSKDASAAVGHWLSLLLQTAEVEAARGHHGSTSLRKEAFLTLRVLVAKVGTADALAFFLPGIVSRFTKVLHVSKRMISGAAGSTASVEHAVRGLTEFLMIVLSDTANIYGLEMSSTDISGSFPNNSQSSKLILEALRSLPVTTQNQSGSAPANSSSQSIVNSSNGKVREKYNGHSDLKRSLHVDRTKEWINETSAHVDKLLSATFPHLCLHPSEKVRKGLVDGIQGLLLNCSHTLERSRLMLLECLCVLVCDDSEAVSFAAQGSLEFLFMSGEKLLVEDEISEIFTRLVEALPRVVMGCEETVAISHARRLLSLMYYAGPKLVVDHLLCSPVKAARFLDILAQCVSHNSQFFGSVDKLVKSKPLSIGYLLSVAELKSGSLYSNTSCNIDSTTSSFAPKISELQNKELNNPEEKIQDHYGFPRMPPWFVNIGSEKLYAALSGILRLAGHSIVAENRSDISLSAIIDIPLDYLRKLISELRTKEYAKEDWKAWYSRSTTGQLLRQASCAVCILNEIMYGLSDQSISLYSKLFKKAGSEVEKSSLTKIIHAYTHPGGFSHNALIWKTLREKDARDHAIYCIGSILHEYMSPEVWNLPNDQNSPLIEDQIESNLSLYFFRDAMMLHQVIIEGIGIFSISVGKDFVGSGFMQSCLYLLLQNLICSNNQIRIASDAVLRVLSDATGHASVGHLVVENADYIIDSLCQQLRHLDLNPHVPDVLAAMLSYVGAAHEILPLLEEPMRAVSQELEVLGRHQHPDLTIPFLKAVCEITKASRYEACRLPNKSESFRALVKSKILNLKDGSMGNHSRTTTQYASCGASEQGIVSPSDADLQLEHWEELLFKLNEMRRYRRIIGSVADSCLKAANPLLASMKESASLLALNIVEDVTISLAKVEEAYKHEKETKVEIERVIQLCSFNDLQDTMDAAEEEEADENRLLPAMNKIWPYLIVCLKNNISVAAIRRCTHVLSTSVQICGGDFFVRRFRTDGPVIWKLLSLSPFRRKLVPSTDERPLLLPYRNTSLSLEDPMAEVSSIKIQAAILNMIGEISSNKRSASALEAVFKKISGLVVGIAFCSTTGLRDASFKALSGLSCVDSDLIWLLVADVYYSLKKKDIPWPPTSDFPEVDQLLPPASSKEYLYMQYGGESLGLDFDPSSVEIVFKMLQSL